MYEEIQRIGEELDERNRNYEDLMVEFDEVTKREKEKDLIISQ